MNYANVDCINNMQEPTSLVALTSVGTVQLIAIAI